jgi:phosphonate transport system ATP-binding protein
VVNLHDLDAARSYCRRIVGMRGGKVVFDGVPELLDAAAVRKIYGDDMSAETGAEAGFSRLIAADTTVRADAPRQLAN